MTFSSENKGKNGSFKIPYSYGLPSYMAPKVFTTQKTEEYLITTLFAQHLLYNQIPVIGVEVCKDDSNKKADSIVKLENDKLVEIQVTRFTLTEYLNRRKIAENKVDKIIQEINKIKKIDIELPGKLQDWYLLTYADFIKELGKKKVKLSLSDEAEWEDYFLQESKKALSVKNQINTTDKEIDQMVYQLYGLTDEEIAIVEGALAGADLQSVPVQLNPEQKINTAGCD